MPYHVLLDTAGEVKLGKLSIGTTRRGIGPCYADKALRLGIRVQDLLDEKILRTKIRAALEPKQQALRELSVQRRKLRKEAGEGGGGAEQPVDDAPDPRLDLHAMTEEHVSFGHRLEPHIADTARLCWDALDAGKTVIFEGAQATLLDLDHGTYPFVTSSNPIAGAADGRRRRRARPTSTRSGASPRPTRPGSAPGPSRPSSKTTIGRQMLERGPRVRDHHRARAALRLDRPGRPALRRPAQPDDRAGDHQARRAAAASTRCGSRSATARRRARSSTASPTTSRSCTRPSPSTRSCRASTSTSSGCRSEADLPPQARAYLDYIAEFVGVPIRLVGVGPDREQVVWIGDEPRLRAA